MEIKKIDNNIALKNIEYLKKHPGMINVGGIKNATYDQVKQKLIDEGVINIDNIPIEELSFSEIGTISTDENKKYEIDENGNVSLTEVHPELEMKMKNLVEKCAEAGIEIRITESLRTTERQDELYYQGRNENGDIIDKSIIVTNAKGSDYNSNHQWGIAFDVCINDKSDPYNEELLNKVGEIGKSIGLDWGGDWETFVDKPHFQLQGYDEVSILKEKYQNPGVFSETWD